MNTPEIVTDMTGIQKQPTDIPVEYAMEILRLPTEPYVPR